MCVKTRRKKYRIWNVTSLSLIGVNVFRSHKLTYERGFAHSSRAHQRHGVRHDVVAVVVSLLPVVVVIVMMDRRCGFFGIIVFLGQAVASRPTFSERIASVYDTCGNYCIYLSLRRFLYFHRLSDTTKLKKPDEIHHLRTIKLKETSLDYTKAPRLKSQKHQNISLSPSTIL